MPLHRLTFRFWLLMMSPRPIPRHDTVHELLSLRPVPLQHLRAHLPPALPQLIRQHTRNPAGTNLRISKFVYDFLNSVMTSSDLVSNVPHCDSPVATNNFINTPFVFGCYSCHRPPGAWFF